MPLYLSQPQFNYTSQTTTYSAAINDWVVASGTTFTITLPDATIANYSGQSILIEHEGSNFVKYTIHTTSSQTILMGGNTYSNADINTNDLFSLVMPGEVIHFFSDGSNWKAFHLKMGGGSWTTVGTSATLGYSATSAYVFTWTGSKSIVEGDVYQEHGTSHFYTVGTTANTTSGKFSGTASPAATGTLDLVTGTGTNPIVYTSRTTTGQPILGTISTDSWRYMRDQSNGKYMIVEWYLKTTAAGTLGLGAYVFQIPGSSMGTTTVEIDTTEVTIPASYPTEAQMGGQATLLETTGVITGLTLASLANISIPTIAYPYSKTQVYFCQLLDNSSSFGSVQLSIIPWSSIGSTNNGMSATPLNARIRYKVPIKYWLV
jgi:hypothetical protein